MKAQWSVNLSMNTPTTLSVLVPAYNEQYLVYASLERLKILAESPLLERIEVIIVDDGSTDQTASVLCDFERSKSAEPNAKTKWVFLRHEVNQGKAAAIRTALQHATAELAVTHDADLEYHPLDPNELAAIKATSPTPEPRSKKSTAMVNCRAKHHCTSSNPVVDEEQS
jgi:glycosyltransferase involved in cell wall biosynthesis